MLETLLMWGVIYEIFKKKQKKKKKKKMKFLKKDNLI